MVILESGVGFLINCFVLDFLKNIKTNTFNVNCILNHTGSMPLVLAVVILYQH